MADETKLSAIKTGNLKMQFVKLGLELGPLLVFFVCTISGQKWLGRSEVLASWFASPMLFATASFMVVMPISLFISWLVFKRLAIMPLVTLAMVLIFGGLTLYFGDTLFIKVKATILNCLFGTVLLGGLVFHRSLLKYVFGEVYSLQPEGWKKLTIRWGLFFFGLAILNEVAWRGAEVFFTDSQAGDSFYAGFKFWAVMPITIVFSMFQLSLLNRYALDEASVPTD